MKYLFSEKKKIPSLERKTAWSLLLPARGVCEAA